MTLASIFAFLSVLVAFGVDPTTINQIHDILIPPAASTTSVAYVPVTSTLIVPNQPVFFGSVAPVNPQPVQKAPAPVVEQVVMDTTPPQFDLFSIDDGNLRAFTNEPLDFAKTLLPDGVSMSITYDGKQDSLFRNTKSLGYYYEAKLTGASGVIPVTVQDMAGNKVTRNIEAR